MRLLFLDFETYYAKDYTLRKMTPAEYILDPRFEMICCAEQEGMSEGTCVDGPDFGAFLTRYDPKDTCTVTFNALFDNCILAWHYGFVPAMMLDAMGMARALRGHQLPDARLKTVAQVLGIGTKWETIAKVDGMTRAEIMANPTLWAEFQDYSVQDNRLCAGIFYKLFPEFPFSERRVMDRVLRACVEPHFRVDTDMLRGHILDLQAQKQGLLSDVGLIPAGQQGLLTANELKAAGSPLRSTPKFCEALEALGVVVKYKTSPTGRNIPALSKTDAFMEELQEHPDPRVQTLACARLGVKSTIEESRAETMLRVASLPWQNYRDGNPRLYSGGTMPIPLRYGGAHTHRLSGDWKMNMQNLPTLRGSKGKSKLRLSLLAPPNHVVLIADLGQIEARLVAWIARCLKLMQQFTDYDNETGLDPYAIMATAIFGYPVDRKVQKVEGFIGKTGILGLGYGCGDKKFYDMVVKLARLLEIDLGTMWSPELANKSVIAYRSMFHEIPALWSRLGHILHREWLDPRYAPVKVGPVSISYGKIALPSGLFLNYANPGRRRELDEKTGREKEQLVYQYGRIWHKIYGAKSLENIVQAIARIILTNAQLRINDRCPIDGRMRLQAHDELVYIVRESELDSVRKIVHEEMTRRPSWAPDLPLKVESKVGHSYGDAK